MKRIYLIFCVLLFSIQAFSQTTPWSSSPPVTPQTRSFSGAKQIRWLWGSNTLYSLDDSLAKYRLIPGNGLTNNSGTIDWGGLLTNPFTIFSGDQKAVIFSLTDNSINTVSQMLINGSAFGVTLSNTANNFAAGFAITPSRTLFGLQNNTNNDQFISFGDNASIGYTTNSIILKDSKGNKGVSYGGSYSAVGHLDSLWIPNWGYVDSLMGKKVNIADTAAAFAKLLHLNGPTQTVKGNVNFSALIGFSGVASLHAGGLNINRISRFNNTQPILITAPSGSNLLYSVALLPAAPGSDTSQRRFINGKITALLKLKDSLIVSDTNQVKYATINVEGNINQTGLSTGQTSAFWDKHTITTATDYASFRTDINSDKGYAFKFTGTAPGLINGSISGVTELQTDSTTKLASTALLHQLIGQLSPGSITYNSGNGTSATFTSANIVNKYIDGVWRDGIEYFVTSGTPIGNQVTVNTTTGVVVFQDNINTGEYIKIRYRGISGISSGGGSTQLITVNSYSEMASQLSGSAYKIFYVKADEVNGGGNPTEYLFYNGILIRNVPQQAN